MHQYNNVILEQHKHIEQIINPFILLSNYPIMFLNLYYHTIPQNARTHKHIQINHKIIYVFIYIHKCTCTTSYLLAGPTCLCDGLVLVGVLTIL